MRDDYNQTANNVMSILDDDAPPKIYTNELTP